MTTLQLLTTDEITRCCPAREDAEGFGALRTAEGSLPLRMMDIQARIAGLVATQTVRQTFVNTLGMPLEATYIFPLPNRAAVTRFRLEVGERIVEGDLQERGQARRTYDQAIQQGHRAAITEEERPGVFTMRVGNIMPGEEATIWLDLTGPLAWQDGEVTYRFPLVVAPRYVPGMPLSGGQVGVGVTGDTDACPDASRISPPVLLPGYPNPVRLSIGVDLDGAGLELGTARTSLPSSCNRLGTHQRIELQPGARLDQDFVLRFQLGSERIGASFLTQADPSGDGGTFQLTLVPPHETARSAKPRDVIFVLDRSGSMGGWKMVAARRATARMVDTLGDRDRFAVYAFDNSIEAPSSLGTSLQPASNRNRFWAVEFLAGLEARGGTEMAQPLQQAASQLVGSDPTREKVLVLVTDGQVGNEDQILRRLGGDLERIRIFTLGIDRAVNAGFLQRLAGLGGGYCELVESEDRLDEVMDQIHRRIDTPVLTDLELTAQGGSFLSDSIVPGRLPALFAGTPVQILGRYQGSAPTGVAVRARDVAGFRSWDQTLAASSPREANLGAVWARGQIRQLEDRWVLARGGDKSRLEHEVVAVSLSQRVLSRFTAFVAVDRSQVVNEGGQQHQVTQAVETPAGWGRTEEQAMFRSLQAKSCSMPISDAFSAAEDCSAFAAPSGGASFAAPPPSACRPATRRSSMESKRRRKSPAPSASGFFGRLLRGGRVDETAGQSVPPMAEWPYRRRAKDLLALLHAGQHEPCALRESVLRRLLGLLVTLVADVRSVGLPVNELDALRVALEAALVTPRALGSNELTHLWARAEQVLRGYALGNAATPAPSPQVGARREGFWR